MYPASDIGPIHHRSRHTQWGGDIGSADLVVWGFDWSAAAFVLAIADGEGGTVLETFENAAAGSEGVSASYEAEWVNHDTGEEGDATIVTMQVNEAFFETVDWGSQSLSAPKRLYLELAVTPVGEGQRVHAFGDFYLYAGAAD